MTIFDCNFPYQYFNDVLKVAKIFDDKRILVFAGAGISRDSGLPIANELIDEIKQALDMPEDSRQQITEANPPFELLIETLTGCSDITALLEIFKAGDPCLFHKFCALLSKSDRLAALVTTNFDMLFEQSFATDNIPLDRYWKESHFEDLNLSDERVSLIKIHGSAHDLPSLGTTIRQVANQKGVRVRENALKQTILGSLPDLILVVGYSGSDRFDINPSLERLAKSSPQVVLIAHNSSSVDSTTVEQLNGHANAGVFSIFNGLRIECDASVLFQTFFPSQYIFEKSNSNWTNNVTSWLNQSISLHGQAFKNYACGALLRASSRPLQALKHFTAVNALFASPWLEIETNLSIARCIRDTNTNRIAAFKFARKALKKARISEFLKLESKALIELGVLYADTKKYKTAIKHYGLACKIAQQSGDDETIGICLGNSAIARKNMGGKRRHIRAMRDYVSALKISCELGDKRSEGRTIGNIGILHSVMGNQSLAIKNFENAAHIARELGDQYHEAIWLVCHADDIFLIDLQLAIDLVHKAKEKFISIGSIVRVAECDEHLQRFKASV